MIRVDFNTTGAELMIDIFKSIRDRGTIEKEKINKLMDTKVMQHYINHINQFKNKEEKILKEDIIKVISNLDKEDMKYDNKHLDRIHNRYIEQIEQLDYLESNLTNIINNFNKNAVEEQLSKYLPDDFELESTAYLICTHGNGGYFKGDDIILDLYFTSQSEDTIDRAIAHILHHIAYFKIYDSVINEDELPLKYSMIADLVSGLIGEGIGYHCMDTIPEEGEMGYNEFWNDVEIENVHFKDMNDTLKKIINGTLNSRDEFMEWIKWHMSQGFGSISYIGLRMIETIDTVYGEELIVKLLFKPHTLISAHNKAAKILRDRGEHVFIFEAYVEEGVGELGQFVKRSILAED